MYIELRDCVSYVFNHEAASKHGKFLPEEVLSSTDCSVFYSVNNSALNLQNLFQNARKRYFRYSISPLVD